MFDFNVEKSQSKNAKEKRLHELLESVTKWRRFLKLSFNIIRFFVDILKCILGILVPITM